MGAIDLVTNFWDNVPFVNISLSLFKTAKDLKDLRDENSVTAKVLETVADPKILADIPKWYKEAFTPPKSLQHATICFTVSETFSNLLTRRPGALSWPTFFISRQQKKELKRRWGSIKTALENLRGDFAIARSSKTDDEFS